MRRIAGVLLD